MTGRGRGLFLGIKRESRCSSPELNTDSASIKDSASLTASCSSDISKKDSGVCQDIPQRIGRGKVFDLSEAYSSMSLGRGRLFLENIGNLSREKDELNTISDGVRGRAKVIRNFFTSAPSSTDEGVISGGAESCVVQTDPVKSIFSPGNVHGSKGAPIMLACNYIQLCSDPTKGVFVYEVRFQPNVDSNDLRMRYLNEHRDKIGTDKTFDGVTLYLPFLLKDKMTILASNNSETEVRILFKRQEMMKDCIHLYNVLFDRVMKTLNFVRFNRKQFDPSAPKVIPHAKLEVWPGYITAVDEYEGGLSLCCDVSHRLLCQKSVLDMLVEIYLSSPNQFQENAKKSLLGSVVITRYNNRTYRIDDIYFDKNPLSTFQAKDSTISYVDYYKSNYSIDIKDKKQPLLLSIKKQRDSGQNKVEDINFCLIPEVCFLTGLRDDMRSDFKLMREIATFTRVSPNQRMLALEKFYKNIENSAEAKAILQNWGLTLNTSNEHVNGRQMPEEQIYFGKKDFSAGPNADFSKHATNNELQEVVNLHNWLIIHCKSDTKIAKTFSDYMGRNSRSLGIRVQAAKTFILDNDRVDTFVDALRKNINKELQIVICICPTNRHDRYAAIKKICCFELPIPSQVINARTLWNESKNRSIVQKIALQINCKLGGTLWSVKIPLKNVMICGIDSYHDAAHKGNSVSAFVASINHSYTKWYSKAVIQTKNEEIVKGLCSAFTLALRAFQNENNCLPENVIIYRDGVGDGQLPLCTNFEVPQFEKAFRDSFSGGSIKITFIVVQKRINTRYFMMQGQDYENPLPGTIVDHTITRKNMYDFFLVSQSVRQGTVSPSHYIVLRDDANYNPDILQRLSYKLCFMYFNWPGTIRVPACCQYAHKLASLVGQSIGKSTAEELSTKLFYL